VPSAASSSQLARAAEALVGTDLDGRYRIEALLGAGGMGAVFRGHHLFLDRPVAIKVLRPHLARDPVAARRFVREARGTHAVVSDHAVQVLDCAATDDGLPYIVLELLDGRTVADELRADGPLAPRRAVRIARGVCAALAAAHRVGLIHRDLKPENLMLVRRGGDPDHVKVLDFGLAKAMETAGDRALSMAALTQGGVVFGTPDYMAPEQALGEPLDGRCDLYSLGATLFEMLTGQPPFSRASALAVLAAQVREPAPRLASLAPVRIPAELDDLVAACLAKRPADRPASADELAAALAGLEPTLAGAGPRPPSGASTAALPAMTAGPTTELPARGSSSPSSPAGPPPETNRAAQDEDEPGPAPRRGSLATVVAVAAALGLVILGITLAARGGRRDGRRAPPAVTSAGRDAPHAGAAPPDAAPAPDAALATSLDAGAPRPATIDPLRDQTREQVTRHLEAARAAQRAGNRLRQLAEADAALALAPGNRTARYLIGDALVGTGDLAKGCRFLREARQGAATARADAVGCP
jgi:serine/threonine protein kinase